MHRTAAAPANITHRFCPMSFADRFEMEEYLFQGLVATMCGDTRKAHEVEMCLIRSEGITQDTLARVNLRVDLMFRRCPVMTTDDTFEKPSHLKRHRNGGYKVIRHDGRVTRHEETEAKIMRCRYLLCEHARVAREQQAGAARRSSAP